MNDRIKEIAVEADLLIKKSNGDEFRYGNFDPRFQKFAELIVRECAQLAMTEHHSTSPADYEEMEPYEQGCDDTASAISGKIRRIFGVG